MYTDKEIETLQKAQKWEPAFRELMDQIYYTGYSNKLLEEKPEEYQREYISFISLYDEPPPEWTPPESSSIHISTF